LRYHTPSREKIATRIARWNKYGYKNRDFRSISNKDFLNETDCLGGRKNQKYELTSHQYNNNLEFLIASDGFGDELISDKMDLLFDYFKTKYGKISRKNRNHELKKEIKQFLNEKNNDDKSVIFVWTK
jgi:serine/threonine protein phosphatase PrpC